MVRAAQATAAEQSVIALYDRFVLNTYRRSRVFVRGKGAEVWDINGKRYLDFGGGIAVNALGHAHPAIREAMLAQLDQLVHTSNLYYTLPQALLAEKIVAHTGAPGRVFFCNSGAEANELLFKFARRHGHGAGRFGLVTMLHSFHGRTLAGIHATGQEKVRERFGPPLPGFVHAPFNDLAAVEAAITPETAAVLTEGIQGESGIVPARADFLLGLRDLCDRRGLLLLIDAVQCGMFRTGRFQSWQRILEDAGGGGAFAPDGIAMAKSLGGGVPIGAVWIAEKHAGLFQPGSHGTTFGGTPLACAAALAVFDTVEREGLMQNARRQGEHLMSRLAVLAARRPDVVRDVRGLGCMAAIEITRDALETNGQLAEAGLLLIPSGTRALRFLPPLNITDAETAEACDIVARVLQGSG